MATGIFEPILINPFFMNYILPLLLVFVLVFAILEKTQLLGEGKRQINAIVGLIIGIILIAFPFARDIVVQLMPFLAVSVVILFVFMLLYGFIVGNKTGDVLGKYWKWAFGTILTVALVTFLLIITGLWDNVYDLVFGQGGASQVWVNVVMILVIAGAIIAVLFGGKETSSSSP